jgi:hypothetical protein
MSFPRRRWLILALIPLLPATLWLLAGRPPPGLVLKYGWPPGGKPTGRTMIAAGVEYEEWAPGYHRIDVFCRCEADGVGKVVRELLDPFIDSIEAGTTTRVWWEHPAPFWLARDERYGGPEGRDFQAQRGEISWSPESHFYASGLPVRVATVAEYFCREGQHSTYRDLWSFTQFPEGTDICPRHLKGLSGPDTTRELLGPHGQSGRVPAFQLTEGR